MTSAANSKLRAPFIITLSTISVAAACGSEVTTFSETSSAGGGGSVATSTSDTGGNSSTSTVSTTSVTTGGGNMPDDCPADPPSAYELCTLSNPSGVCKYTHDCQSGLVELGYTCSPENGMWMLVEQPCDYEYDSCPGTELYCSGIWWMPTATNPPAPCPDPKPQEGSPCYSGGFGGVHHHCGYTCGEDVSTGWTIATCYSEAIDDGVWEFDDVCAP